MADLVTFTGEIHNRKLHFLCSVVLTHLFVVSWTTIDSNSAKIITVDLKIDVR